MQSALSISIQSFTHSFTIMPLALHASPTILSQVFLGSQVDRFLLSPHKAMSSYKKGPA